MLRQTLSSRIFLTFSTLFTLFVVAGGVYGDRRSRSFLEQDVSRRLTSVGTVLRAEVAEVLRDPSRAGAFANRLAGALHEDDLRLSIIDKEGSVLLDTEAPPPLESHKYRPEFVEAMRDGTGSIRRPSATTKQSTFYYARRVDDPATKEPLGVLRLGANAERMDAEMVVFHRALLFGTIGALLMGLVGTALLSRYLTQPLALIRAAAARVAAGGERESIRVRGPREVEDLAASINRMSQELNSRYERLEHARSETAAILASMREGVIAVDRDERVLLMNEAAAQLLGLRGVVPTGESLWKAVRFPDLEDALRRVLAGEFLVWQGDSDTPADDGKILAISVSSVAAGIGAVAILSDVTAVRRLERVRIDFVANVSHEMRTPLAALIGAVETLTDPEMERADTERFLDIARRNAKRMQLIVEDLLDLSKIEVEGDKLQLEPLALDAIIKTALSALALALERKKIAIAVDEPGQPVLINGNAKRLEQIFTNLIDNAIKYTPEGGKIAVRIHPSERDVEVEVEDTGIGIPEHALQRVFERFYRVDKHRARDMGGTGLGLAIVKHAVRAHGGRVTVKSEEGHGTTFTVTLPRLMISAGAGRSHLLNTWNGPSTAD